NCTLGELSKECNLSTSTISRYRNGSRRPSINNNHVAQLARGIALFSNMEYEEVFSSLNSSICNQQASVCYPNFSYRFHKILSELNIKPKKLAEFMNYDSSYISLVRNNKRKPTDYDSFTDTLCNYIGKYHNTPKETETLISLMEQPDLIDIPLENVYKELKLWLLDESTSEENQAIATQTKHFLTSLEEFNLDEYIRAIHFDTLKVPTLPFLLPTTHFYHGLDEMKKAELDFLKSTVLDPAVTNIYMFSDMDMADMASDKEFAKKWMGGLALALKKGHHIHTIHNIHRPMEELMLGLEGWIPLYMTGQVHPYYFPQSNSDIFCHLEYYSETTCCHGESIKGHHSKGMYYVSRASKDLAYHKNRTKELFEKATPLMNIYDNDHEAEFYNYYKSIYKNNGTWYNKFYHLPLYTLSGDLVEKICIYNHFNKNQASYFINEAQERKKYFIDNITHYAVYDEFPFLTKEEFEHHPAFLTCSNITANYSYELYLEHQELTKKAGSEYPHYHPTFSEETLFRNIKINVLNKKVALITKDKHPHIHFVIHHPELIKAIQDIYPIMYEE
ncbi:MAG: helix-turn-helix domain-containing protein, partial [Lachnospiraceae bacterium]|nr:helix-turn-helix domain-containing protein [Lachnospiraceae bacterium]